MTRSGVEDTTASEHLGDDDPVVDLLREPASAAARLDRVEHEMLRLARLATMGDLLAEAVHEIRNPLVSVKPFLSASISAATDSSARRLRKGRTIIRQLAVSRSVTVPRKTTSRPGTDSFSLRSSAR